MEKPLLKPKPKPVALADGRDDHSLLEAISQLREEEAFDELFRRFEQAAYNLALYITRKQELAADAVQEGLLRVWLHARTFKPELSARSWILRIVAREAIKAAKRELKREEGFSPREELGGVAERACGVEEGELRNEALLAMRRELNGLCATDRQFVALYFGAGLLQHEIGRICGVPQSTVSRQLRRVLALLRSKLKPGGVLGAFLVGTETIGQALCRGVEVPAGLRGGACETPGPPGPWTALRAAAAPGWTGPLLGGGLGRWCDAGSGCGGGLGGGGKVPARGLTFERRARIFTS